MAKTINLLFLATLCLSSVFAGPTLRPSVSHAPIHHAPVHHAPVYHAPVYHAPVHHTPVHHTPVHHAPVHTTPVHHTPVHTPVHHTPVHTTPVHHTPVHHTPVHTTPVHHTPVQTTPVHHNPVHTTPVHTTPVRPGSVSYPHYSQGDAQWKTQTLGHSSSTIGAKGCLMSSVASMVAGNGGKVNGQAPNPATMNKWLQSNGGFSGNNFVWGSLKPLGYNFEGKVSSKDSIVGALNSGKNVLLNVNGGHHYVLATGVTTNGYTVMDPGYSKSHYNFNEVVQAGVYNRH